MRHTFTVIILIAICLVQVLPLYADQTLRCAGLADLAEQLKTQFGEERIGAGLSSQILTGAESQTTMLFQIFASSKGTFTVVVSNPSGDACPLAAGTNWETYPIPTTGTEG